MNSRRILRFFFFYFFKKMAFEWETIGEMFIKKMHNAVIFQSFFGVDVGTCEILWKAIDKIDESVKPIHLLWALYFLKENPSDRVNHFQSDVKTWKPMVKLVLDFLDASLPDVLFLLIFSFLF